MRCCYGGFDSYMPIGLYTDVADEEVKGKCGLLFLRA